MDLKHQLAVSRQWTGKVKRAQVHLLTSLLSIVLLPFILSCMCGTSLAMIAPFTIASVFPNLHRQPLAHTQGCCLPRNGDVSEQQGALDPLASVDGLETLMQMAQLSPHAAEAAAWCDKQGAATIGEISENLDSFTMQLSLSSAERRRLEEVVAQRMFDERGTPARAILASATSRRALDTLAELQESKEGETQLHRLVNQVLKQLEIGRVDWEALMGDREVWGMVGLRHEIVEQHLMDASRLLMLGNNLADQVEVVSSIGLTFNGTWNGIESRFVMARGEDAERWGQWSSYVIIDGVEDIVGKRMVALDRKTDIGIFSDSGDLNLNVGDRLYLASADRAALLELATFDRLPELSGQLARLLREESSDQIAAPKGMMEAACFLNRLEMLPGETEKLDARFRRLQGFQLVQELLPLLRADSAFRMILSVIEPQGLEFYNATRTAVLRLQPPAAVEPRRIEISSVRPIAVIVLIVVVIAAVSFLRSCMQQPYSPERSATDDTMPLYTLKGAIAGRKTVPVLSGTPVMPLLK